MKRSTKIALNVVVGISLYFLFSYSMFLGLQVNTTYGNIGVLISVALLIGYVFLYRKYIK